MELNETHRAIITNSIIDKMKQTIDAKNQVLNGTLNIDFALKEYDETIQACKEILLYLGINEETIENIIKI